jgi:exopolysaccharide production protein ExoY
MADLRYDQDFARAEAVSIDLTGKGADLSDRRYASMGKSLFDFVFALALTPFVGLVVLILCVMVYLQDGRNPLFGHKRVGRNGRVFRCWKIRTMVPDAEARLADLLNSDPDAAAEWAEFQKLTHDPRIMSVGDTLRRTSLDELPQLWNVLRGEMSFVGPRPVTVPELDRYGTSRAAYCAMRPGITGLWQVSGRNEVTYAERVALDVEYLYRMSFGTDIGIIARTAGVVLKPTGK